MSTTFIPKIIFYYFFKRENNTNMQEQLYIITVIHEDYKNEWTNQRLPPVSGRSLCDIRKKHLSSFKNINSAIQSN